ncbi:NAD(P)H-hydrate dehydratase [Undibacterium terreum]|uniref:Bifunctional NAD(P)H-hydrate repair enzyme n=1 Tax=Undibacterium terreum TaxID=1224302 RepID=A0A916V0M1_9BURK|nr:NAD(P)H-hydrate dehydratase [Undibacterium terreum]GGC99701.1 bifunctional NAD(P)H-hydrate repair enzyme [Undibacterium terreum]
MASKSFLSKNALYSVQQIRAMENAATSTLPPETLMRRAGVASAAYAKLLLKGASANVLVIAGPGNNGGDALETAHLLADDGYAVSVMLCGDITQFSADAQQCYRRALSSKVQFFGPDYLNEARPEQWALAIDGLFGIGLSRPVSGGFYAVVERLNKLSALYRIPVLSLDVPSGLDADTGQVVGQQGIAVHATHTLTFIGNKPGLHTGAGKDYAGEVEVADLAIDQQLRQLPKAQLSNQLMFSSILKPRPHNSHKGRYGDVLILGGAPGMAGAAVLAARAAAHCGAGRVFTGFIAEPPVYDSQNPELMFRRAADADFSADAVVIGPGLGQSTAAKQLLYKALQQAAKLVIDADALNLIAVDSGLQGLLSKRSGATVLTPHPLEAARLLEISGLEVQADRLHAARTLAQRFSATVILKGSGTVIADKEGYVFINHTGNPALATAGTGDILAGICGTLLVREAPAIDVAGLAACLHGQAADRLVEHGIGPVGITSGELIHAVRECLNEMLADSSGLVDAY